MLYHIPIEPYETRYTADWVQQYERAFKDRGVSFKTVLGEQLTSKLQTGLVLDACGTNVYKFSQLTQLINLINDGEIKDNDVLFFSDLWFPGIESLFYIRNLTGIDFKIAGVLHAGTYDPWDFTARNGMRSWGGPLERSWFNEFDMIFVATEFHKQLILQGTRMNSRGKIRVTGLPFYAKELQDKYGAEKENIIVFPHRIAAEKQPQLFEELKELPELKDYRFVYTMQETKNRDEYFKLLAKSKIMVSFALQETFGYSTLEALALGCYTLVPNRLSYRETVPWQWRYRTTAELNLLVKRVVSNEIETPKAVDANLGYWEHSISRMITELALEGYNV